MLRKPVKREYLILSACVVGLLLSTSPFVIGNQMQPQNTEKPPADMIHWLRSLLDDDVAAWTVRNLSYPCFEEGLVIAVTDGYGKNVVLLTDGTNVFRTNCANGLKHINRILEGVLFPESAFQDELAVHTLLNDIVSLYYGLGGMITTRRQLEAMDTVATENLPSLITAWLRGTETDPNEFRAIWVDPVVRLAQNKWTATFNRVKPDGSVDRWVVSGRFRPADERVEVVSIEVTRLKEEGFLSYPIIPRW